MRGCCVLLLILAGAAVTPPASGELTNFHDRESWQAAVGEFTTTTFTGFAAGTFVTDQYSGVGALFSDGNDTVHLSGSYVNDGAGIDGNNTIEVTFSQPMTYVGVDLPGFVRIDFFLDDQRLGTSDMFFDPGPSGLGGFGGVVSDVPFDRIYLFDPIGHDVLIDDLHFGAPIPGPAALSVLAIGAVWRPRRRRS